MPSSLANMLGQHVHQVSRESLHCLHEVGQAKRQRHASITNASWLGDPQAPPRSRCCCAHREKEEEEEEEEGEEEEEEGE